MSDFIEICGELVNMRYVERVRKYDDDRATVVMLKFVGDDGFTSYPGPEAVAAVEAWWMARSEREAATA